MDTQKFKQTIGLFVLVVFVVGAINKIADNSDSIVTYLFIALIMVLIAWAIMRLLSED